MTPGTGLFSPPVDARYQARYDDTMWQSKPYRDAIALQELMIKASDGASAKDLAALGKTFATLEMLKLRLRMKPAPKPVDTTKLPSRTKQPVVAMGAEE
jgi:hypothetical protein